MGQLTEHRTRWTCTHETVQSFPHAVQKCNKAQTDTEAGEGAGAAGLGLAESEPLKSKSKGDNMGSESLAPDLVDILLSESGSVSEPLTDIITAAHLEPVTAEIEVQTVGTVDEPENQPVRKFSVDASANQEITSPRREPPGEHESLMETFELNQSKNTNKSTIFTHLEPMKLVIRGRIFHVTSVLQCSQIINEQWLNFSTDVLLYQVSLCETPPNHG